MRGEFSKKVVNGFSFLAGGARKLLLCIGRYKEAWAQTEQGLRPCYCKGESIQQSMAKVTSKFQVTVPKLIAQQYNIRPGDHIDWVAYYKNHGYQINTCYGGGCGPNGGSNRIQFAPVFVSPQMNWAVPNTMLSGAPCGPGMPPPQMFPNFPH